MLPVRLKGLRITILFHVEHEEEVMPTVAHIPGKLFCAVAVSSGSLKTYVLHLFYMYFQIIDKFYCSKMKGLRLHVI